MNAGGIKNYKYHQYLEQKHAKFSVNPSVIEDAVRKAIGKEIKENKRIIAGEVNEVYDVQTENQNVIVRISREDENGFITEKWAIDAVRKAGVPVPEVLLIDEAEDKDRKVWVAVETKLQGCPLDEIGNLSEADIKRIVEDAGKILAYIHSVVPQKFGSLSKEGVGNDYTWESYMLGPLGERRIEGLLKSAERAEVPRIQIDSALNVLKENSDIYKNVTPHLLHGDYGPKHILVDKGIITGIIDFENCKSGDCVYDFSWWRYFGKNRPSIEGLRNGYERVSRLPDDFEKRLMLGKLRLGMDMVWYYENEDHKHGLELAKRNLRKDLKYFINDKILS